MRTYDRKSIIDIVINNRCGKAFITIKSDVRLFLGNTSIYEPALFTIRDIPAYQQAMNRTMRLLPERLL